MSKKEKNTGTELRDAANKIWLAGLGALATAEEEGGKMFKKLVAKGEDFEGRNKEQFEEQVTKAKKTADKAWDNLTSTIDERVTGTLHRLGVPSRTEIQKLTKRVEELTAKVDQLKAPAKTPAAKTAKATAAAN